MNKLGTSFIRNGFYFEQLKREGSIALYQKFSVHPRTLRVEPDIPPNYEVIRIRVQEPTVITVGEKAFEVVEKEVYPRDTVWGLDGFSYNIYEDAVEFYHKLLEKESKKNDRAITPESTQTSIT